MTGRHVPSLVWVAGWSVIALGLILSGSTMPLPLALIAFVGWPLVGLFLLAALMFTRRWIAGLALLAVAAGFYFGWGAVAGVGDRIVFSMNAARYQQVVDAAPRLADRGTTHGQHYIIDRGPPVRMAFVEDGILDNWVGVVYDPTDRVAEARGWGPDNTFTAPPEIKGLFGGDIVWCDRITGHWYRCSFT